MRVQSLRTSKLVFAAILVGHAEAQTRVEPAQESSPLWGELSGGPHRIGFRTVFRFDASRTWRKTRDYAGNFSADADGRPIQLNVWYPATPDQTARRMTFGDYVNQSAPAEFSTLNSLMRRRNDQNAETSVAAAQLPSLLSSSMNAYANAPPAAGRFPTVLYFGGLNAEINSNVVLAEFLASHGYVVASVSLLGLTDEQPSQERTPSGLDAVVRDMEFSLGILGELPNTDAAKVGVIGHSVGAIEALLLGLRNGNVSAVIGLDGTYGFKGSASVLTASYGYAPEKMRTAILDLRRAQGEQQADLDLVPILSFRYADRTLVSLRKMHHSDFTSFAMVADRFQVPIRPKYANTGWNRKTAKHGHQHTCRIILDFLDGKVKGDLRAAEKIRQTVERAEGSTLKRVPADLAPPSPPEAIALANNESLEGVKRILTRICSEQPVSVCVDANSFNTFGYDLLGQKRGKDALVVFEIAAWAHPISANAQDSLADGYLATGDKEKARIAIRRAIELAPTDPSIDAQSKAFFVAEENRRLGQIE